jgi:hypothetical protein
VRLAFSHLNLRFNPFGEIPAPDLARLALVSCPDLVEGEVVQFIGESGRGKTTHLLALGSRFPHAVHEKLEEGQDRWRARLPAHVPFFLDEAQRARPRHLRALLASGRTVALGTHEDLSRFSSRKVRTVHVGGPDAAKLETILARRIEWARRGPGPVPSVPRPTVTALLDRHGDDLRAILAQLYDVFQTLPEVRLVTL